MGSHERYLLDLHLISFDVRLGSVSLQCAQERIQAHLSDWESCPFCCKEAVSQAFPFEERLFILWQNLHPLSLLAGGSNNRRKDIPSYQGITFLLLDKFTFHRRQKSTHAYTRAVAAGQTAPEPKPTLYDLFRARFAN